MSQPTTLPNCLSKSPRELVTVSLPAVVPLGEPLILHLTGKPVEHYPTGSMTLFMPVADPATMHPGGLYIIRLADGRHVIQPFICLARGYIVTGTWGDEPSATIPLAEVVGLFVSWRRYAYTDIINPDGSPYLIAE